MTHTDCWMFMIYVFIKTQDNRGGGLIIDMLGIDDYNPCFVIY